VLPFSPTIHFVTSTFDQVLRSDHELYEAVEHLMELVRNKEDDVLVRSTLESVKESYVMKCQDSTVKAIRSELTTFATRLLLWEMNESANESGTSTDFETTSSSCTCPHWSSYLLPCRHIFECRRKLGKECFKIIFGRNFIIPASSYFGVRHLLYYLLTSYFVILKVWICTTERLSTNVGLRNSTLR